MDEDLFQMVAPEVKEYDMFDVAKAMKTLSGYIGGDEKKTVLMHCKNSEEKQFFRAKMVEMAEVVKNAPRVYSQDGKGNAAVVHLHYFKGSGDWFITETNSADECFGYCDLGMGSPELGYVSVRELVQCGVELDLHWTPKTLGEVKKERGEA